MFVNLTPDDCLKIWMFKIGMTGQDFEQFLKTAVTSIPALLNQHHEQHTCLKLKFCKQVYYYIYKGAFINDVTQLGGGDWS